MRTIDADALKEAINSTIAQATKIGIMADADYLWGLLNYAIDNAPTVKFSLMPANETKEDAYKRGYERGKIAGILEANTRPQGEWIPVSERLPEERINPRTNDFEEVICTTVWDDVRHIKYGKPIGHDEPHFWYAGEIWDKYIIAWQYKPEPYQKGDAE